MGALAVAITVIFTMAMAGCSKEEAPSSQRVLVASDSGESKNGPSESEISVMPESPIEGAGTVTNPNAPELSENEKQSLELVSEKDGEKFLAALKQKDTKALSLLMIYAENEYPESDMTKVLEGFLLSFDDLKELQMKFKSNEQNDEYYVGHYTITGTKDGETRSIPFQVKYDKSQGMERIRDDNKREPLYDSPLIGQYPFAGLAVERYIQALEQKDAASVALHLGMYDDNEETKSTAERVIQKYEDSLDLSSVGIISKGYNERDNQFNYELRDENRQTHELYIVGEELKIVDDWATNNMAK